MDDTLSKDISAAMVKRRAGQFAFLKDIVNLDTTCPPGNLAKPAEKLAVMLERLGFEVERHAPAKEDLTAHGRSALSNLVVRSRFGDGPTLAFVCHVDTVPASDGWTMDPLGGLIVDGGLHGLGAVSGKGHLAAQAFAILALADVGARLGGTLELHISFDGESGGRFGARWLLAEGIVKPDMVIAGGPARAVVTRSTGSMELQIEVRGQTAPAYAPGRGHDALEAASQALARIYQFRGGLAAHTSQTPGIGAPSLVVEDISGGEPGGGVPALVTFRVSRQIVPEEDLEKVETQLTNLIGSTIAKMPGTRARIRRTSLITPMQGGTEAGPLQASISRLLTRKLGNVPPARGVAFDHEGRHYATLGIPTVLYGAGPINPLASGMHGNDECLVLDDLRLGTEVLALTALDLLGRR